MDRTIYLGCDHAAFNEKEQLKTFLQSKFKIIDVGTFGPERCNYPDFATLVAAGVSQSGSDMGILICGSGIGVSMVANRYKNIRAALCRSVKEAELARQHNDANVLCLGARISSLEDLQDMAMAFMQSSFEDGRHSERLALFDNLGEEVPVGITQKTSNLEKVILATVLLSCFAGTLFARINKPYFEGTYAMEDGFLEYGTVVPILLAGFFAAYRAKVLRKSRGWLFTAALVVLTGLAIFGAGEEISWGQRIFGTTSPEFFAHNNSQGETNLHNLVLSGVKLNKVIFGTLLTIIVLFYFLILPQLYQRVGSIRNWAKSLALPMPKWVHIGAYILVFLAATMTGSIKKGEILEFGGCWIFLTMFLFPANKIIYKK